MVGWMTMEMTATGIDSRAEIRPTSMGSAKPPKLSRFWMNSPTAPSMAVSPSQYSEMRMRWPIGRRAVGRTVGSSVSSAVACMASPLSGSSLHGDDRLPSPVEGPLHGTTLHGGGCYGPVAKPTALLHEEANAAAPD